MKHNTPLISVVMPVYNSATYLVEALESVLVQTYTNFELLAIDDGSTDISFEILKTYAKKDKRVKVFKNSANMGISETLKAAIKKVKGDYIARMDADDITTPDRLQKQLDYLQKHPETIAIGGQVHMINKTGKIIGEKKFPTSFEEIYKYIFLYVPIQHATIMIAKKRLPKKFNFYENGLSTAEDVELIFKLFKVGKVENLPDYVYKYRLHDQNNSFADIRKTYLLTLISRIKAIYKHNYRPEISGVFLTFMQAMIVLALPQSVIYVIYKFMRLKQLPIPSINLTLNYLNNFTPAQSVYPVVILGLLPR